MSDFTEQSLVRLPDLDQPWHRLPAIVGVSLVIWCGVLLAFGLLLELAAIAPPSPEPIEAHLIDLPVSGLRGGGGGSPGAAHVSPAPKIANAIPVAKAKPKSPHVARPRAVRTATDDILRSQELAKAPPIAPPVTPDISKLISKHAVNSSPPVAQPAGPSAAARAALGTELERARATASALVPARELEAASARAAVGRNLSTLPHLLFPTTCATR